MMTDPPHGHGSRRRRLLLGCSLLMGALLPAQAQDWEATLASWTGRPAIELWRAWGVPSRLLAAPNGNEIHLYALSPHGRCGSSAASGPQPCMARLGETHDGCESSFEVAPDKSIVGWTWRGAGCPVSEPVRPARPWFVPIGF